MTTLSSSGTRLDSPHFVIDMPPVTGANQKAHKIELLSGRRQLHGDMETRVCVIERILGEGVIDRATRHPEPSRRLFPQSQSSEMPELVHNDTPPPTWYVSLYPDNGEILTVRQKHMTFVAYPRTEEELADFWSQVDVRREQMFDDIQGGRSMDNLLGLTLCIGWAIFSLGAFIYTRN